MLSWLSLLALCAGGERQGVTCLAASGVVIAVGGHGGVDLLGAGDGSAAAGRKPLGEKHNTFALAFAGDLLLDGGGTAGETAEIRAWNWKRRELLWKVEEEGDLFYSLGVSGNTVFAGGGDKTIARFDINSAQRRGSLRGHAGAVLALAVSPDGKHLASGGADRSLRLWDTSSGDLLRTIHNHSGAVHALAWSPDGKYLASGSADRSVRLWEPLIGRLLRIIRGHDGAVLALAFTENGIVSGSSDGKLRLLDPASAAIERVLEAHGDWVTGIASAGGVIISGDWAGRILSWSQGAAGPLELDPSR